MLGRVAGARTCGRGVAMLQPAMINGHDLVLGLHQLHHRRPCGQARKVNGVGQCSKEGGRAMRVEEGDGMRGEPSARSMTVPVQAHASPHVRAQGAEAPSPPQARTFVFIAPSSVCRTTSGHVPAEPPRVTSVWSTGL